MVALVVIGALLAIWPVIAGPPGAPLNPVPLLAHVAGMLAGYAALIQILLMSRWPVLERGIGADRLTRWHARLGPAILLLVLTHAGAAVSAWAQARQLSVGAAVVEVLEMPYLVAATVATVLMIVIAGVSIGIARRRLRFETWHGVHLLGYVAVALAFLHAVAGPDFAGHRVLQVLWALLYVQTFVLVVRHRVLRPIQAATRHRLRVERIVHEGPGIVSIWLEGRDLDELGASAGQFFRWRFLSPDTWSTAHPFSLSAAPTRDRLRLTVKTLGDGSRLLQAIDVGTWVVAEGPYGAMTGARQTARNALLIAGGVGITPMRALFEALPAGPDHDLLLLYRTPPESLIFRGELDRIAAARGARVVYLIERGRDSLTPAGLTRHVPDIADRDVYLCGPPAMAAAVRRAVRDTGVPRHRFHEERFDL